MRSLLDPAVREDVKSRLRRLTPGTARQWGRMTPAQVLCHLADGLRIAFGENTPPFRKSFLATGLGRWLVISSPIPWPKGKIESPPGFNVTHPGDFETDRRTLLDLVDRFGRETGQTWGTSPLLGPLPGKAWAKLNWRHLDHHLRQFGL